MDIVTDADVSTGRSRPWTTNPIGISAILIPPPCPLKIVGRGRVCQVVVDDPGMDIQNHQRSWDRRQ